jgi:hypothetical protein
MKIIVTMERIKNNAYIFELKLDPVIRVQADKSVKIIAKQLGVMD